MSVWQAVLLGIIQGITEFLPVSSLGHRVLFEQLLDLKAESIAFLEMMTHIGTLCALVVTFHRELGKLFREGIHTLNDTKDNFLIWFRNAKPDQELRYHKLLVSNYQKFAVLLLVSAIPAWLFAILFKGLAAQASCSFLASGMGFLITAIFLLVTGVSAEKREKTPHGTTFWEALLIGVFCGFSVFPGVSFTASGISVGFLCGFRRKYALKYTYLLMILTTIGTIVSDWEAITYPSAAIVAAGIVSMILASIIGIFCLHLAQRLIRQSKLRPFAAYSFLIGIVCIVLHFII